MTMQPFFKNTTHRETRSEKHSVQKLLEKQLHNQKAPVFLRISCMQFPCCGIYRIVAFSWQKYELEDLRIMFKYFTLQSWHSEAGWNMTAVHGIKVLPAGWLKCELERCMDFPSLAIKQLVIILSPNTENLQFSIVDCFLTCISAEIFPWHLMLLLNHQVSYHKSSLAVMLQLNRNQYQKLSNVWYVGFVLKCK